MSDASKNNEYPTIADLFCLLDGWRHLAGYELERRADIFFALFLPEVLEAHCGVKVKRPLIPEFPIYKNPENKSHNQADYFVLSESENRRQGILVELKTDMASIDEEQCNILRNVASEGLQCLIKYVISLAQNKNNPKPTRQKYVHLLAHLRDLCLIKFEDDLYEKAFAENSRGITKILRDLEPTAGACKDRSCLKVIYVLPSSRANDQNVIDFETFAEIIERPAIEKSGSVGIRLVFAHYLRKWAAVGAGSSKPRVGTC